MINIPNLLLFIVFFTGIALFIDKFILHKDSEKEVDQNKTKFSIFLKKNIRFFSSFFYVFLLVFIVRSFLFEPFYIPSTSMNPTLLEGDFILVKKYYYGIKNPINNDTIIPINVPRRGDIVVFQYPQNHRIHFVKRIIGVPGDYIKYNIKKKQLIIYSKDNNNIYLNIPVHYDNVKNSQSGKLNLYSNKNNTFLNDSNNYQKLLDDVFTMEENKETINNHSHNILVNRLLEDDVKLYYKQNKLVAGEWIVPKSHYFVMGDYRDNSLDSRYWGFISEKELVGQANIIWMSIEKTKNIWPIHFRFNRIGLIH
ncbi:Signal peptidase I [Buchnera aphidicola (Anoecia corni)]|uniref:Signal peptidase I n=1 Tax=Buchnera aphidicola (Anoecia corni) TaxID=2994477 RepID=A0AAT9IGE5_9GAMM